MNEPTERPWPTQKPPVGASVHYVSHGSPIRPDGTQEYTSLCRAADVTEVDPNDTNHVGLMVKNPTGLFFRSLADGGSRYAETFTGGTWHWPMHV